MNEKPEIEVGKLPVITKFIYTLGVLPTSYLMSMTYQEQVTWLYNYLQSQVIPLLNTESSAIQELQNLYELLRTYVNDYFNNLDVQEEIDNKLENMSESGELTQLIKNYVDPIQEEFENTINNTVDNQNDKLNIMDARIDEITSLPDGSTSGDAELADIRVAYNGATYSNAGNSVRGQTGFINNKLDNLNEISGIYEELAILDNGSIPSPTNPDAVNTSNFYKAKAGDIASVSIKRPVSQQGNIYCLSYAMYDANKQYLQNINYNTSRTDEFIVTNPTNVSEKTAYIKIGIWEYNPTSEELVSLRKTDFSPNDVIIKITDRNLVKLNKNILEGQIYFNAYANPIFEKDNNNNLYFHFEQSIITRELSISITDKTLAQLAEIVGETYTGTSPSGLTGCIKIPSAYNLVLDLENQTYAIIPRSTKNANRYLELLCNVSGVVVKGILKHYYDNYMDRTTWGSNKLNKSILEGQIYFNAYANPIFEKDSNNNLYFHFEQAIITRGLNITLSDKTLAQLTEIVGETYTGTSPSGLTGCLKLPTLYNLVIDLENETYAVISRDTMDANRYLELLCNAGGIVVKGILKPYYDIYMEDLKSQGYIDYIKYFGIPSYWKNAVEQAITSVQTNLINSDGNYSKFFFITDQHWAKNAKNSSKLIKYLGRSLHIPLVLGGGDVNWKDYETKIEPISEEEDYVASLEDGYIKLFQTYGNHDFNHNNVGANPDYALTQNQVFEAMINQINRTCKANTLNKDVMYYDDDNERLRIINFKCYLDNNNPQVDNNIKTAITTLVNQLDSNWSIVFFCHSFWTGAPAPSSVGLEYAEHIASLSYTANAKILCLLVGHSHKDLNTTVTASNGGSLLVIGTTTDCIGVTHEPAMTRGTDTEQAFDIVQIDKTNNKIFMTRVGAGSSRQFNI